MEQEACLRTTNTGWPIITIGLVIREAGKIWSMSLLDARDGNGTSQKEGRQSVKRCVDSAICIPQTTGVELCATGKTEKTGDHDILVNGTVAPTPFPDEK